MSGNPGEDSAGEPITLKVRDATGEEMMFKVTKYLFSFHIISNFGIFRSRRQPKCLRYK